MAISNYLFSSTLEISAEFSAWHVPVKVSVLNHANTHSLNVMIN